MGRIDSQYSLDRVCLGSENIAMQAQQSRPVHLRRIDQTQNMRRFYCLTVQPTLFGGASLIRNWGRIGTRGQTMMETFDCPDNAAQALVRIERTKKRRGYLDDNSVPRQRLWVRIS